MLDPQKIKLTNISLYKANLEAEDPERSWDHVNVVYNSESALNLEHHAIRIRLNIAFEGCDTDNKPMGLFAEYGLEFQFIIENLEEFITGEDVKVVDGSFGTTLMSIAFSTTRGIIFEQTKNTPFKGIILPVISPQILLK